MHELSEIQRLLAEIAELLKVGRPPDKRKAVGKLRELANIATTLGFTIEPGADSVRCRFGAFFDRRARRPRNGKPKPNQLKSLAGAEGIEPSHDGIKIRCLTAWLRPIA